ncbi:MAG: hypothetical protein OEV30_11670 [Ignavibacteria bacterium]|nr:hypothetical protein [Ignavibacteria bacterium]
MKIVSAILCLMVAVPACSRDAEKKQVEQMMDQMVHHEINRAVDMVAPTLSQMQDAGYTSWTPGLAVEKLVPLMNAALAPEPGDDSGPGILDKIKYVSGKATSPYQIVLIPSEGNGTIRIEGYGAELDEPIVTRSITVPEF